MKSLTLTTTRKTASAAPTASQVPEPHVWTTRVTGFPSREHCWANGGGASSFQIQALSTPAVGAGVLYTSSQASKKGAGAQTAGQT